MELCGDRGFSGPTACVKERGHEGVHVYGNFHTAIDDELRKDAMRYRWLRDGNKRYDGARDFDEYLYGNELDAAIDEAMSN